MIEKFKSSAQEVAMAVCLRVSEEVTYKRFQPYITNISLSGK